MLDVNRSGYITAMQLNELLSSDASRARTTAIRLKKSLSQKLQSADQIEELFDEAAHGANHLNLAQFRHIVSTGLDDEVTEVGALYLLSLWRPMQKQLSVMSCARTERARCIAPRF